jgi:hypothetical protein
MIQNIKDWIKEGVINTSTGRQIELLNPQPEQIDIEDIASTLSKICRFGARIKPFYTVAQHSILVAAMCEENKNNQFGGLLHDATETYLGDVAKPLKDLLGFSFKRMEERFDKVIFEKYGVLPICVKRAKQWDRDLMLCEFDFLVCHNGDSLSYQAANNNETPLFIEIVKMAVHKFNLNRIASIKAEKCHIWDMETAEAAFHLVYEQLKP